MVRSSALHSSMVRPDECPPTAHTQVSFAGCEKVLDRFFEAFSFWFVMRSTAPFSRNSESAAQCAGVARLRKSSSAVHRRLSDPELLRAAAGQSKSEVEKLIAALAPRPDVPSSIRKRPVPTMTTPMDAPRDARAPVANTVSVAEPPPGAAPPPTIAPELRCRSHNAYEAELYFFGHRSDPDVLRETSMAYGDTDPDSSRDKFERKGRDEQATAVAGS
jgi:hypothetical protein